MSKQNVIKYSLFYNNFIGFFAKERNVIENCFKDSEKKVIVEIN